jgi:long-chain acyl-CoA synthetase
VLRRFLARAGHLIYEGYGLTETAPSVTSTLCSFEPKAGSVGRPVPGVEVSLVDSSGAEVDPDDPGEIRVRGQNLFSGYWPDGREGPDAEGWWCTGDVAVADDAGDLTLVDRRRELILVSGFNVYPVEVEAVLGTHPDVEEVAVLGIPHPYTGSAVKALVVPRREADGSPVALSTEALLVHAGKYLARFKCPTTIEIVDQLPHTATGKVSKGRLRETLVPPIPGSGPGSVPGSTDPA